MSFKIVRNDITKMDTEAIVNTANAQVAVGPGCDEDIYEAAGYKELLAKRKEIGVKQEGEAFITPGYKLKAKYIIHAVSPAFIDGESGEEDKLRNCYRNSLKLAKDNGIHSIAFPLIATGSFMYPKEEGLRIAIDEINNFLIENDMLIYLVVYGKKETGLGSRIYPGLESYIDDNYIDEKKKVYKNNAPSRMFGQIFDGGFRPQMAPRMPARKEKAVPEQMAYADTKYDEADYEASEDVFDYDKHAEALNERIKHMSDTFSTYLLYLIESKGMSNAEVYKRAIVDKKVFSKIKNNPNAHPQKITALCLCVGARLNLDETKDLLARAGYALSPSDITDVIFSFFIEKEIYDMIEIDIQLEEHGAPCLIS